MRVIVTGSSGLIGSAAVRHWDALGDEVIGIDNDMRSTFFGPDGSTLWNRSQLETETKRFRTRPRRDPRSVQERAAGAGHSLCRATLA